MYYICHFPREIAHNSDIGVRIIFILHFPNLTFQIFNGNLTSVSHIWSQEFLIFTRQTFPHAKQLESNFHIRFQRHECKTPTKTHGYYPSPTFEWFVGSLGDDCQLICPGSICLTSSFVLNSSASVQDKRFSLNCLFYLLKADFVLEIYLYCRL